MEPKIRLKGFSGEWEKVLIGKMGTTYSGLSGKTKEDFGFGDARFVTFLNVLTNAIINTSILEAVCVCEGEHQNEVRRGDLLFNTSSETPEEVGMCAVIDEKLKNVYLNSFCFGLRVTDKNIDPTFIAYLMRSRIGRRIMSILAQGATRYNLSKNSFCKTELLLPKTKAEQQLISKYFTSIDSLIQSTTKKIESLKQVKAASLQSMFPQEGETEPRVRFKGYEGKWKKTTFSDIFKFERPDNYIVNSEEYSDYYSTPVLTANKGFILGYTNEKRTYNSPCVIFDDFTLDCKYVDFSFMVKSSAIKILTIKKGDEYDLYFAYHLLDTARIENLGHARHYISVVQSTETFSPCLEEQKCIASFFCSLDRQITLHSQRLEKLKQIKSACLDNMFV